MKKYTVGEVAAKLGVTTSFLKYYEQQGLIDPEADAGNGYRQYTLQDTALIPDCVRLKNLGFTARDIQTLLTSADYRHMLDMMSIKQKELIRQLRFLEYIRSWYARMSDEMPNYEKDSCWSIGLHNNFYFFPQSRGNTLLDDPKANRLAAEWMRWMPMTLCTARADYRLPPDTPVEWGLSLTKPFVEELDVPFHEPAVYVPKTRCLEYWDKHEMREPLETVSGDLFVHMREIVEKYHLVVSGPSYFFVRTRLHENGKLFTYLKILTPIE